MNVLFWPTTYGADLWSLTRYLSENTDARIRVVMDEPESFLAQGVARLFPLRAGFESRRSYRGTAGAFDPDVTIMDNRPPLRRTSPKALMLWHGFGWKGPNDEKELRWLHSGLRRTWGDAQKPNPDFRWQCFGPWDFEHRTRVSGFHPDNCLILGAASHDDLRKPFDRRLAQPYYPFDIVNRKTVLLAPTWHYGELFAHWGSDADLLEQLMNHFARRGANVILRLHDSYRISGSYRRFLRELSGRHAHVMLKFKDHDPDNYLDMQVSDMLLTNFSSIANLFYATGRPSIHIYPVRDADEEFMWRRYTVAGVMKRKVSSARYIWKLPPEEHGGLLAMDFDELLVAIDQAFDDPACCEAPSRAFLEKYMLGADGHVCERSWQALTDLVG